MAEARQVQAFGLGLGAPGAAGGLGGALRHICLAALRAWTTRLLRGRWVLPHGGARSWLVLACAMGLCQAAGLDPSLGVAGALAGGLPHSPLLPGGARGGLALLLFASALWLALALTLRLGLRLLLRCPAAVLGRPGGPPRLWLALVRMFAGRRPTLRSFQGVLPRRPLPPLHDTLRRFLEGVRPALGEPRGRRLAALARSFEASPGPRLQRLLRLKAWAGPDYVSDWWEEHVHLRARGPLAVHSNYYLLDFLGPPPTRVQAARAGNAVFALLRFRHLLQRDELQPVLVQGTLPTCSAPYERMFDTTRVPGEEADRLLHGGDGGHVVAVHGGRFFGVPVRHRGRALGPRELQAQFQRVLEDAGAPAGGEAALGALTAGDRAPWARARALLAAGGSAGALAMLETAAFVVALDGLLGLDPRAEDHAGVPPARPLDAYAKALLHGRCHDRWFDKSFNLVVFDDGTMGLNVEQSWGDVAAVGHLWEYVLATDALELGYEASGDCRGGLEPGLPPPQRLHWDIPDECQAAAAGALRGARALAADLELHVCVVAATAVTVPGPPAARGHRWRPDGLLHLGLLLAHSRDRGGLCLPFEAASGRLFAEGGTEAVGGCSAEAARFVTAMGDPRASRGQRRALLRAAVTRHGELRRAAMTGAGPQRHLFALAVAARLLGLRPPFLCQALAQPWGLAVGQMPLQQLGLLDPRRHPQLLPAGGGFGPATDDGYGVCYAPAGDDAFVFHVSCKASCPETDARRFAGHIRAALLDLRDLLEGDDG
ncbi:carnitine O-palmitoyltransferase 1, liver isoform-like [Struthio camelus]|uniref:carnitine O-palmitoyltransferase 1, liver isoform-like n=1 Tax=Struthio camelus TaxID=8801 RepID=UPI00360426CC